MREEWRQINGFENLYAISNLGRVKRLSTLGFKGTGNYQRIERILAQSQNNKGYKLVSLYRDNKRSQFLVHRLVACAFISNLNNYPCINHKDENPKNNIVDNLEWCTQLYNMNYGSCKYKIGAANAIPVIQYNKETKELINSFRSAMEAQRVTGISNGLINDCCKGRRKMAGGFIWEQITK